MVETEPHIPSERLTGAPKDLPERSLRSFPAVLFRRTDRQYGVTFQPCRTLPVLRCAVVSMVTPSTSGPQYPCPSRLVLIGMIQTVVLRSNSVFGVFINVGYGTEEGPLTQPVAPVV